MVVVVVVGCLWGDPESERGRERGREGGRQGGREAGREGGRERGREGGREGVREVKLSPPHSPLPTSHKPSTR